MRTLGTVCARVVRGARPARRISSTRRRPPSRRSTTPITAARVQSTAWSIASWTWDGGGSLDHGVMAQTRRGIASGKVRRYLTYERDRFIAARLDAGDRQVEVARAFGVSQATVSTFTRQTRKASACTPKLSANLIVRFFWCCSGSGVVHGGASEGRSPDSGLFVVLFGLCSYELYTGGGPSARSAPASQPARTPWVRGVRGERG